MDNNAYQTMLEGMKKRTPINTEAHERYKQRKAEEQAAAREKLQEMILKMRERAQK